MILWIKVYHSSVFVDGGVFYATMQGIERFFDVYE
jgi:hypothetical protein